MVILARFGLLHSVRLFRIKVLSRHIPISLHHGLGNVTRNVLLVEKGDAALVLYADRIRSGDSPDNFISHLPIFVLAFLIDLRYSEFVTCPTGLSLSQG
jgi:hypothetical protein